MNDRPEGVRLQKVLAQAGVASRRAAEDMIAAGRVSVDGKVVREMGRRVDPETAVLHVDGSRIVLREDMVYLALNKPRGLLSTMSDDMARPCVGDLIVERGIMEEHFDGNARSRLFHVGRLDAETEGLLFLMNDGDLGHRLMHPSFEVEKTYMAEVMGQLPRDLGKRMRAGIELEDGLVAVDSRDASTWSGGCATWSGSRCSDWSAPRSATCRWATSVRASSGRSTNRRSAPCTARSGCSSPFVRSGARTA